MVVKTKIAASKRWCNPSFFILKKGEIVCFIIGWAEECGTAGYSGLQ